MTTDPEAVAADPEPTTAFVLGGGGKWGSVQVGMLAALVEAGVRADLVVGCSIGAINGAAFAAQPDAVGVDRLRGVWTDVVAGGAFTVVPRSWRALRGRRSLGDPASLRELVERAVPARRFEELAIPFECVAASIEDAGERWFSTGPLVDPLMASASVPGLFPPVAIGGRHHYDGGLVNSIPVDHAVAAGATRLFVLQVGRVESPLRPPEKLYESGLVAFEIARRHRYSTTVRDLPEGIDVHVLPTGSPVAFDDRRQLRFTDASEAADRMAAAESASREYLAGSIR